MKEVILSCGYTILVSDEDESFVKSLGTTKKDKSDYFVIWSPSIYYRKYLHVVIAIRANSYIEGREVDHRDRNGFNLQRSNLRPATRSQNVANSCLRVTSNSGYKGVHYNPERRKWVAQITCKSLGRKTARFDTAEEAARAYDRWAIVAFGEFARINFPDGIHETI